MITQYGMILFKGKTIKNPASFILYFLMGLILLTISMIFSLNLFIMNEKLASLFVIFFGFGFGIPLVVLGIPTTRTIMTKEGIILPLYIKHKLIRSIIEKNRIVPFITYNQIKKIERVFITNKPISAITIFDDRENNVTLTTQLEGELVLMKILEICQQKKIIMEDINLTEIEWDEYVNSHGLFLHHG